MSMADLKIAGKYQGQFVHFGRRPPKGWKTVTVPAGAGRHIQWAFPTQEQADGYRKESLGEPDAKR